MFAHIAHAPTILAISLTSRRFHGLSWDELLHTIVWKSADKATENVGFWEANSALAYIPTSLAMTLTSAHSIQAAVYIRPSATQLAKLNADEAAHPRLLDYVCRFQNLTTLSMDGLLPPVFYHVLLNLPNLTHLDLNSCLVPFAPPHFPFSYPSFWDKDIGHLTISVTHLTLRGAYAHYDNLLNWLTALRSLTLAGSLEIVISMPALQRLMSLTLLPADSPAETIEELNTYLQHALNLRHLTVGAPPSQTLHAPLLPLLFAPPQLETFTGPEFAAHAVLARLPALAALTVTTPLATTRAALALIERAKSLTLRALTLTLTEWDIEVLIAAAHCLPACRRLALAFRFSAPSEEHLFELGVEHLPRLAHLHTVHLLGRPEALGGVYELDMTGNAVGRYNTRMHAAAETRVLAVPPTEEACGDAVRAWARYNPNLRAARLVPGREWARGGAAGRWTVGNVVEAD